MLQDLRYALRILLKQPAFTAIAALTLALGIGANTAIYSVVNALLLKPLPFPQPQQLLAIGNTDTREKDRTEPYSLSYPDFFDFREQNRTFSSIALHRTRSFALTNESGAASSTGTKVSAEFFDVLGVQPSFGHGFTRADEKVGGGPGGFKAVISYDFWRNQRRSFMKDLVFALLHGSCHNKSGFSQNVAQRW